MKWRPISELKNIRPPKYSKIICISDYEGGYAYSVFAFHDPIWISCGSGSGKPSFEDVKYFLDEFVVPEINV